MKSLQDVIESLLNATSNDKIQWEEKGIDTYGIELSGYYIKVFKWTDPADGTSGTTASLMNSLGKEIDNFSASEYDTNTVILTKLLDFARRNANGVNEAISDIQDELGRLL